MTLKCAPETEAEVYRQTLYYNLWPEIAHADVPAIVLRGLSKEGLASVTALELAGWLPRAEDRPLPEASHHVPMECPEEVVRAVRDLLSTVLLTAHDIIRRGRLLCVTDSVCIVAEFVALQAGSRAMGLATDSLTPKAIPRSIAVLPVPEAFDAVARDLRIAAVDDAPTDRQLTVAGMPARDCLG